MERDLTLIIVGGAIGVIGAAIGAVVGAILDYCLAGWRETDRIRRSITKLRWIIMRRERVCEPLIWLGEIWLV